MVDQSIVVKVLELVQEKKEGLEGRLGSFCLFLTRSWVENQEPWVLVGEY
jgi:hypothetical protein